MKNKILQFVLLLLFSLTFTNVSGQLAKVSYSAKIGHVTSTCQGIGGCGEFGSDPEFTAFIKSKDNINTTEFNTGCLQCDASSSSCTYAQNTLLQQGRENTSDILFGHIEAWEDDVGDRCEYTEYIDINFLLGYINLENPYYDEAHMSQEYSYNFRQWDFPTSSSVFTQGPLWGYSNLHSFKLSCSWRYIGTDNLITPNCTTQTADYAAGGVKSWSLALTAGLTYSFSNCTSGNNGTRLRLYASDGFTALETNGTSCSELVFTPTTTGTYYLEIFQVVNNVRKEVAQPGVLTYSTDTPFAPMAIAQTFCGPTTANSLVPAISITKKWYASATSTTALATTDVLATGTYYVVSVGDGNCESERTPVNITVNPIPSAPIASAQSFCFSPVPTTLDLVATGTNKKWYSYTNDGFEVGTFALTTGTYYVSQTVNGCESAKTAVSVIVNSIDPPTAADYQSFCSVSNPTIANLSAAGSNIKWYSAATGGNAIATTAAISQGNYYASQTINGCESTRTVVYVVLSTNSTPPIAYSQSFCSVSNPTIASLTAWGIAMKWYSVATGGTALASTTAVSTGIYYVSQFDNGCESTRTAVSVTVGETPSAPTAASAQSVCSVANPTIANLTATGTGLKWYYGEIGGSSLATTTSISSGLYYVSQTINGCESSRTTVYVTVTTAPSAPTASNQLLCSASNPTVANLVATGTSIKWYSAATGGTALATTTAINTGTYYVSQTTNTCESTRTAVSVTVGSTISAPTASPQLFCTASNPTVANLTAAGTNIKWYLAATGGTVLATSSTISSGTYYVSQSANGCESTRTPVNVTVNTTLSAPTAYAQSFCTGTNPTVANLVTVVGLVNKWYLTNTGGTALAASTPISTGTYYVSESSSGCESARTPVSVTVNPSPSAPTVYAQSFCGNRSVGHIVVTGTGFTRIYSTATGGTQLSINTAISTKTYYASKFANGCESARIPVSITINAEPAAPTASAQSFCSTSNPTIANLTPSGTGIQWYSSSSVVGTGVPLASTTPISSGTYYVSQIINGCESFKTTVNVTVNTSPSLPAAASTLNYTVGDLATPLTATTGGDGLLWYSTATGGSFTTTAPTPSTATVGSTSYWISSTNSIIGCESDRVEIVVNVNNIITNAPTTNLPTQVYTGNDKNLTTLQVTGSTIKWYNAGTGGTLLPSTTLLVDETTYYASQTVSGVESTTRLAITVNKISENTQTLLGNSTIANLVATPSIGNNAQWYTVASGGTALAGTTLLTNGNYYVEQASTTGITTLGSGYGKSWGVAIQADGKILFTDTFNNAIKRMNADGTGIVTLATGFGRPMGIAVQADGKIVVADFDNNSIKRLNADGSGIVTLGAGFDKPRGVAIQADGKILVADTGNYAIKRMNADGTSIVTLVSQIINPMGLAIQTDGKIVVASSSTIKRMDSNGTNIVTLATGLGYPNKVAIQADGKIVIADGVNNAIKRMNADGSNIVTLVTGLNEPTDVAIQADGKILVADYLNAAIKRYSEGTTSNRVAVAVDIDDPAIASTQTNVLCNGSATGAINISTTGGTAPYTYNWNDGITTEDRTDLIAGTYSVTLTDANGIIDTETITITQPNVLTSSITSQTNVTCYGAFDGSATISAVGGTSGYTYSWAPSGGTTATIIGRAAGDYTCTITDANGCTTEQLVTITQPNALFSSITSQTDVSCNGGSDGSATISASGGASGYTYSWAPSGGTSATITGLTAGDYTCTITDALGCIKTQTVTITQPALLNNGVAQFCGALNANLKGATYQWYACPNTIIVGATNQMYTPTTDGDYKVVISQGGCTVTSACISPSAYSAPTAASTQIICNSGTVANLIATGTGTMHWYAASTEGTALAATTNLASGTYYVSQTLYGCESTRTAVVVSVNPLPASPTASAQTFCNGATVANLVATGTGTMNWYDAATDGTALTTTASLATGTYYVSQTNEDGCESDRTSFEVIINTLPTAPTVTTPVNYILGATATALTATSAGTGLMWYTTATSGTGSATAPTPNTATVGTTSYWVSSTSDAGCESARAEMVVTITLPATHLNFDGVNDYITLTNEAAFDFTNQMTVEFWMNSNTTPTQWDALVTKGDNSWRLALTAAGKINFAGDSGFGDVTSNAVVTDGNWHHVAVTYNGTNAIIYIDGVPNASVSGTGTIANSAFNVSIGENLQAPGRNYTGNMDEVRIWNIARTSFQISSARNCELQGNEPGLVAYYNFNQGIPAASNTTITSLTNAVSGGANGTLQNFALTSTTSNWLSGSPVVCGAFQAYAVTGGGSLCLGGAGISVGLADSETGAMYQVKLEGTNIGDAVAGTGEALSLGNFAAAGIYTVVATNTIGGLTTTMTGSAVVEMTNYTVSITESAVACMGQTVPLTGSLALVSGITEITSGFTGAFAPANWTFSNTNANGTVNTSNAPASIAITGGNLFNSGGGATDYSITAPISGTLTFNWNYNTADTAEWDYPQVVYNNLTNILTGYNTSGGKVQSGSVTMEVEAGKTLALRMYTVDNTSGAATVVVSNFSIATPVVGTPSYAWTTSNGGVISGATDGLMATATTPGTYMLTATVNGCTFSEDVAVTYYDAIVATVAEDTALSSVEGLDGALTVSATGGTSPYSYLWSNEATTASITGLGAGTYTCLVTDANGCTTSVEQVLAYIPIAPVVFAVTGGGQTCPGSGVAIGLANSEEGVSYQLKINGADAADAVDGTGEALSFGDFSEAGSYTVLATNTENELSTTMSGNAVVSAESYIMIIKEPEIDCSTTSVYVEAITGDLTDFEGVFAPENWTLTNDNADGSVDTLDTPNYITLVGGNEESSAAGTTDYSITVPASGLLSFSWDYSSTDDARFDYPQIVYNDVVTTFNGYNRYGSLEQFGTMTMQVEEGATLGLRMVTTDNGYGAASVDISDWSLASSVTGTPTFSWTASNGGVIDGDTDSLEIEATSSGTYTLTATLDDCIFSKSIVLDFENIVLINTTWNGMEWSNGAPDYGNKAIIDGPLVVASELYTCELEITANGSLTVQSTGLTGIIGKITNNATAIDFVVENNGVLIQRDDLQNEGPVTVKRNSAELFRQDYTLWSSPVGGQNLRAFSPQTLYNRFSSYDTTIGSNGGYVQEIFTTNDMNTKLFGLAKGYLIRKPNNWVTWDNVNGNPAQSYEGIFAGTITNGDVNVALSGANTKLNLVGNPYPSPISIADLFAANSNIEKTLYFWRKKASASYSEVSPSGYATYTPIMGLVSADLSITGSPTNIETGQGFFVVANSASPGNLTFTNPMRNSGAAIFYKGASNATNELHRIWLNLSTANVVVGQTLIGYATGATSGIDNGYDAAYFNDSSMALTSLIDGAEYAIQGLGVPFDATSSVPLGFKTEVAGSYTLSLSNFDGLFTQNQDIFIKDNVTGDVHDVKESAYSFVSDAGIFNNRFEVVYQNAVLGTENPILDSNKVIVYKQEEAIHINTMSLIMQKVELYDVGGRLIQELNDVNESKAQFNNLNLSNQVLLVKITTTDKKVITKKVVY